MDATTAKIVEKLNEALKHEWTGVAQYSQASFLVSGLWREPYAEFFEENAKESFGHAQLVGDKIVALGGVPTVERNPVQQSHDLQEMLAFSLEFEKKAVRVYSEALHLTDGFDRALTVFLEDLLKEEQEGVDEIIKIVREPGSLAGSSGETSQKATQAG